MRCSASFYHVFELQQRARKKRKSGSQRTRYEAHRDCKVPFSGVERIVYDSSTLIHGSSAPSLRGILKKLRFEMAHFPNASATGKRALKFDEEACSNQRRIRSCPIDFQRRFSKDNRKHPRHYTLHFRTVK